MNSTLDDRLRRLVHAEFREMPGLRLTHQQARRLWDLDQTTCLRLLTSLVESGFLTVMPDGRYARLGDGEMAIRRSVVAAPPRTHVRRAS